MRKKLRRFIENIEEILIKILKIIGLKRIAEVYKGHVIGIRYLFFGGMATLINIATFKICEVIWNLSTTNSNVIAWLNTVIFAYITNKWFIFDSKTKNIIIEFIRFMSSRLLTLLIETIMLNVTIDYLCFNSTIMKVLSNILVIILNYVFSKIFVFKVKKAN